MAAKQLQAVRGDTASVTDVVAQVTAMDLPATSVRTSDQFDVSAVEFKAPRRMDASQAMPAPASVTHSRKSSSVLPSASSSGPADIDLFEFLNSKPPSASLVC